MGIKILIMTELFLVLTFLTPSPPLFGTCFFLLYKKNYGGGCRSIAELPIITLLASYFEVTPNLRSDGLRADVNIYGLNHAIEIAYLFDSYPLLSCKQDEFKV
jgi:hypothetical protein